MLHLIIQQEKGTADTAEPGAGNHPKGCKAGSTRTIIRPASLTIEIDADTNCRDLSPTEGLHQSWEEVSIRKGVPSSLRNIPVAFNGDGFG